MIGTERRKKVIHGVLRMIAGISRENAIDTLRRERPYAPRKRASQIINASMPHLFNALVGQGDIRAAPKFLPPTIMRCSQFRISRLCRTPGSIHGLLPWLPQRLMSNSDEDVVLTGREQEGVVARGGAGHGHRPIGRTKDVRHLL